MKKFAMSAIAVAAVLGAGAANAYTSGTFKNGFVVPNVVKDATGATTAVGIINQSGGTVPVYWTFFDQESSHIADGCFYMTNNDYEPFVWSAKAGQGMDGLRGYLVFASGNTVTGGTPAQCPTDQSGPGTGLIAGNAFYVDPVAKDVAFTPVIDGPLVFTGNASLMGATSLTSVGGAATLTAGGGAVAPTFSMRYFIDNAVGGNDTAIVVWSTGDQRGRHTVFMYDDKQDRRSVNFDLAHAELDWFNPETIPGRPANFVDGFINWQPMTVATQYPGAAGQDLVTLGGSVFTYSVISSPAFGAVQTVLGAHR